MSQVKVSGNASGTGTFTVAAPNTNTDYTQTLPAATGTVVLDSATQTLTNKTLTSPTIGGTPVMGASVITSGTAQASTSGTSIDFTGIPSWVKRITVMFKGVSTNGSSNIQIQLGTSGGVETSGYAGSAWQSNTVNTGMSSGLLCTANNAAAGVHDGCILINNLSSNSWVGFGNLCRSNDTTSNVMSGSKALSGTLDRVRITTVNGTDTFDAGSINILYE